MFCKIADLITDIPAAGGLAPRCVGYMWEEAAQADIVIRPEEYRPDKYHPRMTSDDIAYMESGRLFYRELVKYGGFYLHSSAVVRDGKAYLFSGNPGAGKSTHTRLWQSTFSGDTRVINDDKPALRCIDGVWYAYGTPWCGKDGININERAPLAGVCFVKKAPVNRIRRLSSVEAMQRILTQTIYKFHSEEVLDKMISHLDSFLRQIPVYELENRPEPEAARLCYETMLQGAQEAGL